MAYLLASGVDPFPASEEKGLEQVFSFLSKDSESPDVEFKNVVFLAVLYMYGEGMMGDLLRKRLNHNQSKTDFRRWMLQTLSLHLQRVQ